MDPTPRKCNEHHKHHNLLHTTSAVMSAAKSLSQRAFTGTAIAAATGAITLLMAVFIKHSNEDQTDKDETNGIPGSNGTLPFIGDTVHFALDPRKYVADGFELHGGNVFRGFVANKKVVFVRGKDLAEYVYTNDKLFNNDQFDPFKSLLDGFLLIQSGEVHRRNRKLIVHALSAQELRKNLCFIATEFSRELDLLKGQPSIEFYTAVKRIVLRVMMRVLMGVAPMEADGKDPVERLLTAFGEYGRGFFGLPVDLGTWNDHGRALRAREVIFSYFKVLVEQRRATTEVVRRDLLQTFVDYKDEETGLSVDADTIAKNVMVLLFASIDTTTSTAASIVWVLNEQDHIRELVFKECKEQILGPDLDQLQVHAERGDMEWVYEKLGRLEYLDCVIKETLRTRTPLLGSYRTATQDIVLPNTKDCVVPKGWMVCVSQVNTMTHDHISFPEPDQFKPERFLAGTGVSRDAGANFKGALFPFSLGPHTCPGYRFAIYELKLLVCFIVAKSTQWPRIVRTPKQFLDKPVLEGSDGMDVQFMFR